MIARITSKRQVTFPKRVMDELKLKAGDSLVLSETEGGVIMRPRRFTKTQLAPLRDKIQKNFPPLDLKAVRNAALDPHLRD